MSFTLNCEALKYSLPSLGNNLFGSLRFYQVKAGDDFAKIARQFDIGFYALAEANPQIDPKHLVADTVLVIPTQNLLPSSYRSGIVINLASMQLFYFPANQDFFYLYPIGIGRENWTTPLGVLFVLEKIKNPIWRVPKSILDFRAKQGDPVPKVFPSGPNNPLGLFALRLSKPTYLIHGTNDPTSIGLRSSAGCIHLYPEDIKELFSLVTLRTPVFIINQPYLAGWDHGHLYVEAHIPLQEQRAELSDVSAVTTKLLNGATENSIGEINTRLTQDIIREHTGVPAMVGSLSLAKSNGNDTSTAPNLHSSKTTNNTFAVSPQGSMSNMLLPAPKDSEITHQ